MFSAHSENRWQFVPTNDSNEDLYINVSQTFEDFQSSLSDEEILHPSEERHRQIWLSNDSKVFDVINSYHIFCKLCKKHFYSRSVPTDINSFFQNHINGEFHREFRDSQFPRGKEMITWEKKWSTGKCNVCQMTEMVAFCIDAERSIMDIYNHHICVWKIFANTKNQEFLRRMGLLIKYCKLPIFKEKFIKPLDKGNVCLLCCVKIPWSGEDVKAHLGSESHLNCFRSLIQDQHKLSFKDLQNGFNLEMVTQWILGCVPKPAEGLVFSDYESYRLENSLNSKSPYSSESSIKSGHYCPLEIEKLIEPWNFPGIVLCFLCKKPIKYKGECKSKYNTDKSGNPSIKTPNGLDPYAPYCKHLKYQLEQQAHKIEQFKKLREGTNHLSLKVETKNESQTYVRTLFLEKLALIKKHKVHSNKDFFCNICDLRLPAILSVNHFVEFTHIYNRKRWQILQEKANTNVRFFEPFQNLDNTIICLLCGVFTYCSNFFFHLKSMTHLKLFEWYCSLNNEVPISSAIEVRPDLSVVCYLCDSILSKNKKWNTFKMNLNLIENHWPCPVVTKQRKSLKARNGFEMSCMTCGGSQKSHSSNCQTNILNIKKVENAITGLMQASEGVIFNKVLDLTKSMIHDIESATSRDEKKERKAACDCEKSEWPCKCKILKGDLKPDTDETKTENTNHSSNEETGSVEKEREILVISGLEKCQKKINFISKLKKYGKIYSIHYEENCVKIIFVKQDVAKTVAKTNLFKKTFPFLTVTVESIKPSEIKSNDAINLLKSKFPPMPPDLLELLEQPLALLNFVVKLYTAATAAAESEKELSREKWVCETINSAVSGLFPQCRCYPFGSRLSGLMFESSDLDVFLDCGGMYEGADDKSPLAEKNLIHNVAAALRKKPEVTKLLIIDRARVPIISFYHKPAALPCDLSVKNGLSVHNTLLIRYIASLDYQIKFMFMFLKYWAKKNSMHGPPFFSSYAITMLAIFYLQQLNPPMVPTIEELEKGFVGQRLTIGGWNCSFSENNAFKSNCEFPFHLILRGFFCYYANFEYEKFVISPLDGKPLPREAFSSNGKVKLPMSYKRHILSFPQPLEKLVCPKIPICIIDPFDLSFVLTKSFTQSRLEMFKYYCELSSQALKKATLSMLRSND